MQILSPNPVSFLRFGNTTGKPITSRPVHFSAHAPAELTALNPAGFKNTFTLHFPENSRFNVSFQDAVPALQEARLLVEGDLHANTRKLLELLFAANLVESETPDQTRALFSLTTRIEELSPLQDKAEFNRLLKHFQQSLRGLKWTDDNRALILAGDTISDRGADDRFTMALVRQLNQDKADRIRVIAGNHELNAIDQRILPKQAKSGFPGMLNDEAAMREDYKQYLLNASLFEYLPEIKALLTHAPINALAVDDFIDLMSERNALPPRLRKQRQITEETMAQFVDCANAFYREVIRACFDNPDDKKAQEAFQGISRLVWQRSDLRDRRAFPFRHISRLKLIHGHDSESKNKSPYSREVKAHSPELASYSHSVANLDNYYLKNASMSREERPLFLIP